MHWLLFIFTLWLVPFQQGNAQVLMLEDTPVYTLNQGELSYLRDPSREMTLEQVRVAQKAGEFHPLQANLGLGYTPDAVWLHIQLNQSEQITSTRWLEIPVPYLDDIRIFHIAPSGQIEQRRGGDMLPQSAKEEAYRAHLFKLDFTPGQHQIFIRVQTTSTMAAIIKLWQPDHFEHHQRQSYFVYGLYFSLILTVLLFNAVSWLVSLRPIFLVYAGYLFLNTLQWLGINGFIAEFIFPEQPLLANLTLGMSLSLAAAMAFGFFMMVLELKKYHPVLYRISQIGIAVSLATALATPFGYYGTFAPWLMIVGVLSLFGAPWPAWRIWRTGGIWGRLLVIAYLIYVVLVSINILGVLAVLPFNEAIYISGMASNIAHILLLHFAILLHYRRIEVSHAEATQKLELERGFRQEQGQLLTMLTHELKNPLATVRLNLDVMPPVARYQKHQQRIHRALDNINGIIDRCAQVDRFDQGQMHDKQATIDVNHWLTDQLIRVEQPERVQLNVSEPLPNMRTDPDLLSIALLNLIDNALKYAPEQALVRLQVCEQDYPQDVTRRAVCFRVSNPLESGTQLPQGEQIYSKYYRGEKDRAQSGSGLGLYLAKGISKNLGGHLRFSTENNQIEFELCIPLTSV